MNHIFLPHLVNPADKPIYRTRCFDPAHCHKVNLALYYKQIAKRVTAYMSWVSYPFIKRCVAAALTVGTTFLVSTAPAATSAWFEHDHGAVRLIYGGATTINGETRDLGLQFRMKPGWKVYWRSPGDAGFPPQIDWSASVNFADASMSWPAPKRFLSLIHI